MKIVLFVTFTLICFAFSPPMRAVTPPPDGCYPAYTTAEGCNALQSLTTGLGNTAVGWYSLFANSEGSYNTAVGAGALNNNIGSSYNTAIDAAALALNRGTDNTATGAQALANNFSGSANTANGAFALFNSTGCGFNTAVGYFTLRYNNSRSNTAVGAYALSSNVDGEFNTAIGLGALASSTGDKNIAVGIEAGQNLTAGNNNIDIGNEGLAGDSGTIRIGDPSSATACFIAGINGATASGGTAVYVDTNGQLGTLTSSARFKEKIKPMDQASESILNLKPITFRYKKEIEPARTSQFGLLAEDVEKVNPDLVVRDKEGKPYTVRYEAVNAMLLNEFLKEHNTVQELKKEVAALIATVKEQAAHIQKVSAQLELSKAAPQTVKNND
jgi:Chaperone of endosialidase